MSKKNSPGKPKVIQSPGISPEADPSSLPPIPLAPEEELDVVPDEDLFETPPYEDPEPGEGP